MSVPPYQAVGIATSARDGCAAVHEPAGDVADVSDVTDVIEAARRIPTGMPAGRSEPPSEPREAEAVT
ncbi:hypothetical protein [Streptomyces sp. NPDC001348]